MTKADLLKPQIKIEERDCSELGGKLFFRPFSGRSLIKYYQITDRMDKEQSAMVDLHYFTVGASLCDSEGNRLLTTDADWDAWYEKPFSAVRSLFLWCLELNELSKKKEASE